MITGTLLGSKRVIARLFSASSGLKVKMKRGEQLAAEEIADIAKDLVAVDTGATQENIRVEQRLMGWAVVSDRGGDRPEVAVYLEYGTRFMPARPYMSPALSIYLASRGPERTVRGIGGLLI